MQIIAIANQKGGVGKSTTAHNIGRGLLFNGYKVLFIDLDYQCNLTYTMGALNSPYSVVDLIGGKDALQVIQHTEQGDIITAHRTLAGADRNITGKGSDLLLKKAIEPIKKNYDFIIIDTPPALSILTVNAFSCADKVIIPAQADIYSLQGIGELYNTISAVKEHTNPDLTISGIVLTRYNGRATLTKNLAELLEQTAEQIHTKVYKSRIREAIAVKEAQASMQDIFSYARRSNPAKDYNNLINEILADK